MKSHSFTQCVLCMGDSLAQSIDIFNEKMAELAVNRPTYERIDGGFIIFYRKTEWEAECIAEEKELQGIKHTCSECNHCNPPTKRNGEPDGRVKNFLCNEGACLISRNSPVCDVFYKEQQDKQLFAPINMQPSINNISDLYRTSSDRRDIGA